MRITLEADYALRMVCELAKNGQITDAKLLSDSTGVPQRFSLKILRKLSMGGIVRSFKGVNGGYTLASPAKKISMKDVIELIDGPIAISRCMSEGAPCSINGEKKIECTFHNIFSAISEDVSLKLGRITIADAVDDNLSVDDLINNMMER